MKRLILRFAALGTVVVLGLIAIAQAQRGSEDLPPASGELTPAGKAPLSEVAPRPIDSAATAAARPLPGEAVSVPEGNPLRGPARQVSAAKRTPSAKVLLGNRAAVAAATAAQVTPEELPARRPATDPFAPPAGGAGPATNPVLGKADPGGKRIPAAPGASLPTAAKPPAAAVVAPGAAGASVTDRNAALPQAPSESREPWPLTANPYATPARVPPPAARPFGGSLERTATDGRLTDLVPPAARPFGGSLGQTTTDGRATTGAALAAEGTGRPGSKLLEGPQSPQLVIQKLAPEKIQVGRPAVFRVTVRNVGPVAAGGLEVHDQIPKGTRLIDTTPRAARGAQGELVWTLGTLNPGDEAQVEVRLMPIAEGEIGSVATVSFRADASARSVATKPELVLKSSAPSQVLIGEQVTFSIEVSNPGSGTASGVVLEEHVPAGLQHDAGKDLEYEIGELPPGESRKLQLTMTASRAGPLTNVVTARGDANLRTEHRLNLEVIAPLLDVAVAGPQKRYLEREAVYKLSVHNPGTAPAEQIELVAYLPSGLKFISANNAGHYEEVNHTVHWQLEELPVNETGTVELVTMPIEAGQQKLRVRGTAEKGLTAEEAREVAVEGIAAIKFEVVDVTDPIEVGGETTYEVRVVNQGTKAATNVRLVMTLPAEMQPIAAEGPTRNIVQGSRVLFGALARLAPKADTTYRVRVKGLRPGDLRIPVQLWTDEMRTPVTKEESTRVYSDQ